MGFVYAAIASGISWHTLPHAYIVEGYEPKNYRPSRLAHERALLTASINTISVKVLIDAGFEPTIKLAHQMGIKSQPASTGFSFQALGR